MVYEFWILEIRQLATGEYEHTVQWAFDADADIALIKAKAIFHALFATEDQQALLMHTGTIVDAQGNQVEKTCIVRPAGSVAAEEEPAAEE